MPWRQSKRTKNSNKFLTSHWNLFENVDEAKQNVYDRFKPINLKAANERSSQRR